jgi:hypothetical protein
MGIDPLWLPNGLIVPAEFLAVSYTRNLVVIEDGIAVAVDGVEAARRQPSAVDLRCDIRSTSVFDEAQKARILAFKPLRADRRGVVRMECGEFESRPKNLNAARERLALALMDALATPVEVEPEPRKKRGRAGLVKVGPDGQPLPPKPVEPPPRRTRAPKT